jgi:hypothetical protein
MRPALRHATLLLIAAAAAGTLHARADEHRPGPLALTAAVGKRVTVTGIPVSGLYPGATATLAVRVTNPYGFPIRLRALTVAVARATTRPGCAGSAANLAARPMQARIRIKPRRAAVATAVLTMPRSVVDGCQGAVFRLTLSATAAKG